MSPRAQRLAEVADAQLAELAACLGDAVVARLAEPCPGRAKLGDGTVGAVAAHTVENFHRLAAYASGTAQTTHDHQPGDHTSAPSVQPAALVERLEAARRQLSAIRGLSDEQLDATPAAGEMRFADGERTLEQVISSVLRHQSHQVDVLVGVLG